MNAFLGASDLVYETAGLFVRTQSRSGHKHFQLLQLVMVYFAKKQVMLVVETFVDLLKQMTLFRIFSFLVVNRSTVLTIIILYFKIYLYFCIL